MRYRVTHAETPLQNGKLNKFPTSIGQSVADNVLERAPQAEAELLKSCAVHLWRHGGSCSGRSCKAESSRLLRLLGRQPRGRRELWRMLLLLELHVRQL